jgi:integrase
VSEIVNLELSNLKGSIIQVRLGKGRKDREVSITERTIMDLDQYIKGPRSEMLKGIMSPYLLIYVRKGKPHQYKPRSIGDKVRWVGSSCDPPIMVSPHDLRRSGAQLTYMANPTDKTVRDLQSALGHRSADQTREYIGAGVVDQQQTFRVRDRYLEKLYPEEFSQTH